MSKYNTFNGCEEANLKNWTIEIASHLTTLSWSQAFGLALWSFGLVLADRSGISSVVAALAQHLSLQEANLRQQLREWLWSAGAKKGQCRREVVVTSCFKPLLSWLVSCWPSSVKQLVLALDASTLFDRFTVLAIKVVYRGTAIPVAWKIKPSKTRGAWKTYWLELLEALRGGIPADWQVLVAGDQGLYEDWLFHKITGLGWHPFLRIKADGYFRLRGQTKWREISRLPRPGGMWSRAVVCFKEHPLECTLLSW